MPNIPGIPESLEELPGVQMNAPPPHLMPQVMGVIETAVAQLKEGEKGRIVWIAQIVGGEKSVNAAHVMKLGKRVQVTTWFGKTWGKPTSAGLAAGTAGSISW
jgi:hypothetical protein